MLAIILLSLALLFPIAAPPLAAQPLLDAPPTEERVVELVLARSEHQAQVVARAMWTGFLIDQLLIPETAYLGQAPWSKLQPGLRKALQNARPGEPTVLNGAENKILIARILPGGPPALLGEREYAVDAEEIRAKVNSNVHGHKSRRSPLKRRASR